jgi:hypothetical protein
VFGDEYWTTVPVMGWLDVADDTGCGRNNSHTSKEGLQTNGMRYHQNFLFPKCRYQKVFLL